MGRSANELKPRSSVSRFLACVGFLVGLIIVADVVGLPHVRWDSRVVSGNGVPTVQYVEYWSLTGPTKLGGPLALEDVPVVKFMRPRPPVHVRLGRLIGKLINTEADGSKAKTGATTSAPTHEGAQDAR